MTQKLQLSKGALSALSCSLSTLAYILTPILIKVHYYVNYEVSVLPKTKTAIHQKLFIDFDIFS